MFGSLVVDYYCSGVYVVVLFCLFGCGIWAGFVLRFKILVLLYLIVAFQGVLLLPCCVLICGWCFVIAGDWLWFLIWLLILLGLVMGCWVCCLNLFIWCWILRFVL